MSIRVRHRRTALELFPEVAGETVRRDVAVAEMEDGDDLTRLARLHFGERGEKTVQGHVGGYVRNVFDQRSADRSAGVAASFVVAVA